MPAPRAMLVVLKTITYVLCFHLLASAGTAQTSVNDIHIVPRETGSALSGAIGSNRLVGGSMLHVVRTDVKLVLVPVSVTDPMQRLVKGLRAENFAVFEGKKPQEIRHFSSEDLPVSVGIILDASGSMADKMI